MRIILILLAALFIFTGCANDTVEPSVEETTVADTTLPFSERRSYDWSKETVETSSPELQSAEYPLSYYAVTDSSMKAFSNTGYGSYVNAVDALRSYQPSIELARDDVAAVLNALCECCPYASLVKSYSFTPLVAEPETTPEDAEAEISEQGEAVSPKNEEETDILAAMPKPISGTLSFTFLLSENEHKNVISAFDSGLSRLLGGLGVDSAAPEASALLIYRWCSREIDDVTGRDTNFTELMSGISFLGEQKYPAGNAQNFAMRLMLLQSGIPCVTFSGKVYSSTRIWTAAQLGGLWYHFDPSSEFTDTSGNGLKFFGMNDSDREYEGYTEISNGSIYAYEYTDLTAQETLDDYNSALALYMENISDADNSSEDSNQSESSPVAEINVYKSFDTRFNTLRDCDFYSFDIPSRVLTFYHIGIAAPDSMILD